MPGFDAQFCLMIESEFIAIRKLIDLILVTPEQIAEKIRSYCYRLSNIIFKSVIDEISFWRDQIVKIKDIILKSKYFKNTRRICNDMLRCSKLYSLVASKPAFGNKTEEELRANSEIFQQYVCNGKLLEAARQLLDTYIGMANAFIDSVKTALNLWVNTNLGFLIAQYQAILKLVDIPGKLETLDSIVDCIFGVCNIGATVKNYKQDTIDRLNITPNGQVDRSKFMAIINSNLNKIDKGILGLQKQVSDTQNKASWRKISKTDIAHN